MLRRLRSPFFNTITFYAIRDSVTLSASDENLEHTPHTKDIEIVVAQINESQTGSSFDMPPPLDRGACRCRNKKLFWASQASAKCAFG